MTVQRYTDSYLAEGCTLTLTAPYDRLGGEGALVDGIFGVAKGDVDSGVEGEFETQGVFNLTKTASQSWNQGQKIYWDITNKRCDSDPAKGPFIGFSTDAAASGAAETTGSVKLVAARSRAMSGLMQEGSPAPTSKNTAGAVTLTAAEVLTGILVADPNGAGRTYTLPTAALLVAAVPGAKTGDLVRLKIVNGADAAETLTIAEGSGGSWDSNQPAATKTVAQNGSKDLLIRLTNVTASSEAYVCYL